MDFLVVFQVLVVLFSATSEAAKTKPSKNSSTNISCVLVFGDSTVDPGNNNYIETIFNSNFLPYGRNLPTYIPKGRFTNGKLVTDFFAEYVGLKEVIPPYLDPTLSIEELTTGVSFASAVAGYDPLTPQIFGVISLQEQLNYFREYKRRIAKAIGNEKTKAVVDKAFFLISAGTNDYVFTYFDSNLRHLDSSLPKYQQFLLNNVHQLIQDLIAEGAKRIAVVGLPPIGCLPLEITLSSIPAVQNRRCVDELSSAATKFNEGLEELLKQLRRPNIDLIYADVYTPIQDMIQHPQKYGFTETNRGCCGTGFLEVGPLCNPASITCSDDSKYVFWDSMHPTQAAYYNIFKTLRPIADAYK